MAENLASDDSSEDENVMFTSESATTDLIIVVEDKKIFVERIVLALSSPVFCRMFHSDFKEKSAQEIPLPGKKYRDFVEFLLCIYPSTMKQIDKDNVDVVLSLADEYQMEQLKKRCETYLLCRCEKNNPSNSDLAHILYLADRYCLRKAFDKFASMAVYRPTYVMKSYSDFNSLSGDAKADILFRRLELIERPSREILRHLPGLITAIQNSSLDCGRNHKERVASGRCLECITSILNVNSIECLRQLRQCKSLTDKLVSAFKDDNTYVVKKKVAIADMPNVYRPL
ncbi:BTB and MATH domain-containing protein 38-like [Haliotis asinina]|uniref:BTB and MATH domain-containing protein 38-like n=1 Tax=Haliotis asinina TaxID=109174 RepID=UPI003531B820